MNAKIATAIAAIWDVMETENPDKSTEWLLEAVAFLAHERMISINADAGTVAEALITSGFFKKAGKR